ncbi:MAG: cyclic nucleotide-binding domain-containing protein [Chloroflexota bacterium]
MKVDLRSMTMFSQLPDEALAQVKSALKERQLATGEILFNQGDPGNELVIVEEGKMAIFVPAPGNPQVGQAIRVFQPGELLGEMALIDRKPRSASARAEEASTILTLSGDDFRRLLGESPEMTLAVMGGLSDRIRYTTDFLGEVRTWIRRIAEGNYQTAGMGAGTTYADKSLAELAEDFARMAAQVQEREEQLRREVAQLRIEIDEAKRKQEAERIMGSEYYRSLKERAKRLREQDE